MSTNQNKYQIHNYFMNLALQQAMKSLGNTKLNPSVGCVISDGKNLISAACTSFNGRPHAERNAINLSKRNIKNANLYTTLEPCIHYGKTPPCTNLIIKKKIKKVFFSIKDPDKRTFNKSKVKLKKNGIKVASGFYSKKINYFYKSYIKYKKNDLPFVTCKVAVSNDFYTINKKKKIIKNQFSQGRVHLMRSSHDCLITSSKTVIQDNPMLTCRINGLEKTSPARIILDKKLSTPLNSKVIKSANTFKTIIFYNKVDKKKKKSLNKLNARTIKVNLNKDGNINLREALLLVKKIGFNRIFIEAGLNLSVSFLKEKIVDEFKLFISHNNLKKSGKANIKKYLNRILKNNKYTNEKVNLAGDKLRTYQIK